MARSRRVAAVAVAFFASVVGFFAWSGCVGDDPASTPTTLRPDPGVPEGHHRGACAAGDVCLTGLVCEQGVCIYPDGGGPAPGTGDGASSPDGSDDALSSCAYDSARAPAEVQCPGVANGVCSGSVCCLKQGAPHQCLATAADCAPVGAKPLACETGAKCGGLCCVQLSSSFRDAVLNATACPIEGDVKELFEAKCHVLDACPNVDDFVACRSDAECAAAGLASSACQRIEVATDSGLLTFGVCR